MFNRLGDNIFVIEFFRFVGFDGCACGGSARFVFGQAGFARILAIAISSGRREFEKGLHIISRELQAASYQLLDTVYQLLITVVYNELIVLIIKIKGIVGALKLSTL
jgi:hypothetical protein